MPDWPGFRQLLEFGGQCSHALARSPAEYEPLRWMPCETGESGCEYLAHETLDNWTLRYDLGVLQDASGRATYLVVTDSYAAVPRMGGREAVVYELATGLPSLALRSRGPYDKARSAPSSQSCGFQVIPAGRQVVVLGVDYDGKDVLASALDPVVPAPLPAPTKLRFAPGEGASIAFASAARGVVVASDGELLSFPWGAPSALRAYGPAEKVQAMTMAGDSLLVRNLPGAQARRVYRVDEQLGFQALPQDMDLPRAAGTTLAWLEKAATPDAGYTVRRGEVRDLGATAESVATRLLPWFEVRDAVLHDSVYVLAAVSTQGTPQQHVLVRVDLRTGTTSWRNYTNALYFGDVTLRGVVPRGVIVQSDHRAYLLANTEFKTGLPE
jgi:hypothetical protein